MQRSRRLFLKYLTAGTGSTAAVGTWWFSTSSSRAARWARRLVEDARRSIAPAPLQPTPAQWSDNRVTFCWVGHSTVLLNFYGIKILTDPAFGSRVGISLGVGTLGPKRYIAPALRLNQLPPIDLILLSHAHMDHFDLATLRKFPSTTQVVSAKATADLLRGMRVKPGTELGWGEATTIRTPKGEVQIEALEVKHWGQRWPSETPRGYNGYVLRREGKAILFGGDTALTPLFKEIASKGPFEAAIMPIGAYRPWIWNHCTPEQAVEMANMAQARYLVPVHHQTFRLSEEPMLEPIERFQLALAREPERMALTQVGGTFELPTT